MNKFGFSTSAALAGVCLLGAFASAPTYAQVSYWGNIAPSQIEVPLQALTPAGTTNSTVTKTNKVINIPPIGGTVSSGVAVGSNQPINIAPYPAISSGQAVSTSQVLPSMGKPEATAENTQYYIGYKEQLVPTIKTRQIRVPVQRLREVEVEQVIMVPKTIRVKKQVPYQDFETREEQYVTQKRVKVPQYYKATYVTQVYRQSVEPVESLPSQVQGQVIQGQAYQGQAYQGQVFQGQVFQGQVIPGQVSPNLQPIPVGAVPAGLIQGQGVPTGYYGVAPAGQ